jgi:hypothetical protein
MAMAMDGRKPCAAEASMSVSGVAAESDAPLLERIAAGQALRLLRLASAPHNANTSRVASTTVP